MKLLLFSYRMIFNLTIHNDLFSTIGCKDMKRTLQLLYCEAQYALPGSSFYHDGATP